MRIPIHPPTVSKVLQSLKDDNNTEKLLGLFTDFSPTDHKDRYLHWDKFRFHTPHKGYTVEESWAGTKLARQKLLKPMPFTDTHGNVFKYGTPDCVLKMLHEIDQNASGRIYMAEPIANTNMRDAYLINSLIEEAINSSQLEGAATTRKVAKQMLRQKREPKTKSEQMILNNYHAMQFVQEFKDEDLNPDIVFELHKIVTRKTLENEAAAGAFRTSEENIQVVDNEGNILHIPPKADELPQRLQNLCDFANGINTNAFIHPVVRAILLHFMLAYDHPFVDGNGRTARALFYWSMAREKYWLIEFISISKILKEAPIQYARSFLHTENDDNDATYFIIHQLEVIQKAISYLHEYLGKKMSDLKSASKLLEKSDLSTKLNYRQLAVLDHALKNPSAMYSIKEHQTIHNVSYQTARVDLLNMADDLKLLQKLRHNRTFIFMAPTDLKDRLEAQEVG